MPATRLRIFISSVQTEFSEVRRALKAFLLGDAVLARFVADVFLFEDLSARDRRADEVYLHEVDCCDVYLGIFGNQYGSQDAEGVSPTEREFDRATEQGKTRLIYVWGTDDSQRCPEMKRLIRRASGELVRRRVEDMNSLNAEVYSSLIDLLDERGALRVPPFDTSVSQGVTLKQISQKRVEWFLQTARRERGFPLKANTATKALLTHLNLLPDGKPNNAAVLLFGTDPHRVHPTAEVKCVHCHTPEYRRPFASQQVYTGDLFEQVDQARDFVLSKINRTVGMRKTSAAAPAEYELPPDAVGEAIVNAVAHRDFNSNGSVEVRLFPDRLEIWNPGALPTGLTPDALREDHPSIPRNPLLAEVLYLARYIEKAGSGTQAMIEQCRVAGLQEPDFVQRRGSFVATLWRNWLTEDLLAHFDLNDRQRLAIDFVRTHGRISNSQFQAVASTNKKTATRDLTDLKEKGLVQQVGTRGPGVHYVLAGKGDILARFGSRANRP
jgi:predicted HTH transcriptional regulator